MEKTQFIIQYPKGYTKTNDIITDNDDDEDNFLGLSDATNINKENANNEDNHTDLRNWYCRSIPDWDPS